MTWHWNGRTATSALEHGQGESDALRYDAPRRRPAQIFRRIATAVVATIASVSMLAAPAYAAPKGGTDETAFASVSAKKAQKTSGTARAAGDETTVADASTIDNWRQHLENSTENIGRIWTDKSVFTGDAELTNAEGRDPITVSKNQNDSDPDFLVGLSALSSVSNLTKTSSQPLDIVLVLDVSGSMDETMTSYTYEPVYRINTNGRTTYYAKLENGAYRQIERVTSRWGQFDHWELNGRTVEPKTSAQDTDPGRIQFYTRGRATSTRKLQALKAAVNSFIQATSEQSGTVQNRIALVKYAGDRYRNSIGDNTYRENRNTYNYTQVVSDFSDNFGALSSQVNALQAGMGLVDFTNPAARDWFKGKVKALLAQGVDAIKTDFGERIPRDVVWFDGSPKLSMHNWYTQLYNQTVFEAIEETYGKGQACLFARSATVGGQTQPVHWGGDCESTFNGMAQTLRAGLSLISSGFGFWSHDIGGFEGAYPDPALYKRWIAFGLLSSHSRLHGSSVYRVPWLFDEEDERNGVAIAPGQSAVDVTREFTKLKLSLMPYLYQVGLEPHRSGTPVMRSMFLEFPDDLAARPLDRQYMLGPSLLVAPVFTYSGEVDYYLPEGTWTNWFTGERAHVVNGQWRHETHAYDTVPLWVRDGSVLVTHPGAETPEYEYGRDALVRVFLDQVESAEATVTETDGTTVVFSARRTAAGIEVTSSDGRDFTAADGMGQPVASVDGKATL